MSKTQTNVAIGVAVDYTGKGAIARAKNDLGALGDAAKKLAGAFALEQVITKSLSAFKAETVAVTGLTNALGNLGVSFSSIQPVIEDQVTKFASLGFTGSQTVDAMAHLTTALGNPAKALDVLGVTADLARYKQISLTESADTVAKAIAGSSRAFALLGLKIDKTLTPQNAFNKLIDQAKQKAGGLATAYSQTAAGAMDVFAAKTENASAKLGQDLAPSIAMAATFADAYLIPVVDYLTSHVDQLVTVGLAIGTIASEMKLAGEAGAVAAEGISSFFAPVLAVAAVGIRGIKALIEGFKQTFAGAVGHIAGQAGALDNVENAIKPVVEKKKAVTSLQSAEAVLAAWDKKWQAQSLASAKALTAEQKKKLQLERDALSLKLAGNTTDLQNIEIQAALQRGQTQDVVNVLLLQRAILTGNADQANILAQQVLIANGLVMKVDGTISSLATAKDPFADWPQASDAAKKQVSDLQATFDALNLDALALRIKAINDSIKALNQNVAVTVTTTTIDGNTGTVQYATPSNAPKIPSFADPTGNLAPMYPVIPKTAAGIPSFADPSGNLAMSYPSQAPVNVVVNLNGQTVGNAITNAQVDQSASGIPNSFARNYAGAW